MAQLQLPIFPAGVTEINSRVAVRTEAQGRVFYLPRSPAGVSAR